MLHRDLSLTEQENVRVCLRSLRARFVSVRYHPAEKDIIKHAGLCMYILRGSLNGDQQRDALVKAMPKICPHHRNLAPPVICHIHRSGEVTLKEGARRGAVKQPPRL